MRSIAAQQIGRQKRQKNKVLTKTELSHTSICRGCARLSLEKVFAVFAIRAYIANTNTNTQSYICNVEFVEVPHAIESHMNLCNCAEESAVKILSREEGGGGKNLGKEFMQTSTKDMQQAQ